MQRRSQSLCTSASDARGFRLNRTSSCRFESEGGSDSDDPLRLQRARLERQVRKQHAGSGAQ